MPEVVTLKVGGKQQLVAVGRARGGKYPDPNPVNLFNQVTWRVASGSEVASVDAEGMLTRLAPGTAQIEASAQGKTTLLTIGDDLQPLFLGMYSGNLWGNVYIYTWTGTGSSLVTPHGPWPGTLMKLKENNLWTALLDKKYLVDGSINVVFNSGTGFRTQDLVATQSSIYDNGWKPWPADLLTKVSVDNGTIKESGNDFATGRVLTLQNSGNTAWFSGWEGDSFAYIFTNPSLPEAKIIVPGGKGYLWVQAAFDNDPFPEVRNEYARLCTNCHGVNGAGGVNGSLNQLHLSEKYTLASLAKKINDTMPLNNSQLCLGNEPGSCAYDIANMIISNAWRDPASCSAGRCVVSKPSLDNRNLRLLTREEYLNSVRDLFAKATIDASVIASIPEDARNRNFETASFLALDDERAFGYQIAAETVATQVLAATSFRGVTQICSQADFACQVSAMGRRVFRRPMTQEEVARYTALYDVNDGGKLVIQALLTSPHFLYRSEMGVETSPGSGVYRLSNYEIATLLAYSLWASTPDEDLLNAAALDSFDIKTQLTRILADPRAERGLRRFVRGWLLNGSQSYAALPSPTLASAFDEETTLFALEAIKADKLFNTLLTADYTYANSELAQYYGTSPVASGWAQSAFADNDPRRGTGIFGHGSFLATTFSDDGYPSPSKRGQFVRDALLCQDLSRPQHSVTPILRMPEETNRAAIARHTMVETKCASCHQLLDGIGFGFERFGSDAKYRTQEKLATGTWQDIDASGWIRSLYSMEAIADLFGEDVNYQTIPEMAKLMLNSGRASACYSRQFYRYIIGRAEASDDESIIRFYSPKRGLGGGMQETLTDLVLDPSFILRR